jgi:hypothetical protein
MSVVPSRRTGSTLLLVIDFRFPHGSRRCDRGRKEDRVWMMSAFLSSDQLKAEMRPRPLRLGRRGRPRWLPESNQGAEPVTPRYRDGAVNLGFIFR